MISTKPGLARYLRTTAGGLLRTDEAAIKAGAKLDRKYLLRSSDPELSPADIALGYKQLWQIERGWRDMKQIIDLRPVYHRREDRIRAHVVLCWLALLRVRVAETSCEESWPQLRRELEKLQLGSFRALLAASASARRSRLLSAPSSPGSSSPSRRVFRSSRRQHPEAPRPPRRRYTPLPCATALPTRKTATFRGLSQGTATERRARASNHIEPGASLRSKGPTLAPCPTLFV